MSNLIKFLYLAMLVGFGLSPDLVLAGTRTASGSKLIGISLLMLLLIAASFKTFFLVKKERTSPLSVFGLGITLIGLAVYLLPLGMNHWSVALTDYLKHTAQVIILIGATIAAIGWIQFHSDSRAFNYGKSQAILALAICLLAGGWPAYSGFQDVLVSMEVTAPATVANKDDAKYSFYDRNFDFTNSSANFELLNAKKVNEQASLVLRDEKNDIFFMVVADADETGTIDLETLEKVALEGVSLNQEQLAELRKTEKVFNQNTGVLLDFDQLVNNKTVAYRYWLFEHNGFSYQLIGWAAEKKRDLLEPAFEHLAEGFSLQSNERLAFTKSAEPFEQFQSDYGYSVDLVATGWRRWKKLEDSYPAAEIGGELGNYAAFTITPFCYPQDKPHDDAIVSALMSLHNVEYPHRDIKIEQHFLMGAKSGEVKSYSWEEDGTRYYSRLTSVVTDQCAFLVMLWANKNDSEVKRLNDQLLGRIEISLVKKVPNIALRQDQTAMITNRVGLYYFNQENYQQAASMFKLASQLNPQNVVFVNNALNAFNNYQGYSDAIAFAESPELSKTLNNDTFAWLAWIHQQAGNRPAAKKYYQQAFSNQYRNDKELSQYIDLLLEDGEAEFALQQLKTYVEDEQGVEYLLKMATIYRHQQKFAEALKLLEKSELDRPYNADIAFEKIYVLRDMNRHREIIDETMRMIEKGQSLTGAYYQKGVAEYDLKWFDKAKKSFEEALKLSPNNSSIQEYLATTSGMLGEGDSSSILEPIQAVEWDESIKRQVAQAKPSNIHDAYFVERMIGYFYEVNKPLRKTRTIKLKVLTPEAVKELSTLSFNFDPYYEKAYVNYVRVLNQNGELIKTINPREFYVTDALGEYADTDKTIHIPIATLAPGYQIDYQVTTETYGNIEVFPYSKIYHSSDKPVQESIIFIKGNVEKLEFEDLRSLHAHQGQQLLWWQAFDPIMYLDEPMLTDNVDYLSMVIVNQKAQDWKTLGEEYLEKIHDKLALSPQLKTLVQQLTADSQTSEDKVSRIIRYVQDKVVYKALEFGARGQIPKTAQETVDSLFGDCKDHAVLTWAMLTQANIKAHLALVGLKEQVNPIYPSLDQFDHMIVYLPEFGDGQYLDTTDKDMNLMQRQPMNLGNTAALILESGKSRIETIGQYQNDDNQLTSERVIEVVSADKSRYTETFTLNGYLESGFRSFLKGVKPKDRFDWAYQFLTGLNRNVQLLDVSVQNLEELEKPLMIQFEYELNNTPVEAGAFLVKDAPLLEYYYLMPRMVSERKRDFQIRFPLTYRSNVEIKLPEDFSIGAEIPSAQNKQTTFGQFDLAWKNHQQVLVKQFQYHEKAGKHSRSDYQNYFEFAKAAVDSMSSHVRIKAK